MEAAAVKQRRVDLGLTQLQLAQKLGVNVWTVAAWEQGKQRPPAMLERALRDIEREMGEQA